MEQNRDNQSKAKQKAYIFVDVLDEEITSASDGKVEENENGLSAAIISIKYVIFESVHNATVYIWPHERLRAHGMAGMCRMCGFSIARFMSKISSRAARGERARARTHTNTGGP